MQYFPCVQDMHHRHYIRLRQWDLTKWWGNATRWTLPCMSSVWQRAAAHSFTFIRWVPLDFAKIRWTMLGADIMTKRPERMRRAMGLLILNKGAWVQTFFSKMKSPCWLWARWSDSPKVVTLGPFFSTNLGRGGRFVKNQNVHQEFQFAPGYISLVKTGLGSLGPGVAGAALGYALFVCVPQGTYIYVNR